MSGLLPALAVSAAHTADIRPYLPGLRRWARTAGGEWHGPCPRCGGTDRLLAWPDHPKGPRALCRQCHEAAMDPIALVQWLGLAADFPAAVALLAGGGSPNAAPRWQPAPDPAPDAPRPYRSPAAGVQVVARYAYYAPGRPRLTLVGLLADPTGPGPRLLYQKERREPGPDGRRKTFVLRHPRAGVAAPQDECPGDWWAGAGTAERWPYNLPAALAAPLGAPILWVDGEKDCETARAAGLVAVCAPDGAGTWRAAWGILWYDHPAIVIPDQEPGGPELAARIAAQIAPYALTTRIVAVPAKDLSAWVASWRPEGAARA